MTADGMLYVKEHLAEVLEEDIKTELAEHDIHAGFTLDPSIGEWGSNLEKRWPVSSEIPIHVYDEPVGVLTVELDSTIKHSGFNGEYLGKELTDYDIRITDTPEQ